MTQVTSSRLGRKSSSCEAGGNPQHHGCEGPGCWCQASLYEQAARRCRRLMQERVNGTEIVVLREAAKLLEEKARRLEHGY